MTKLLEKHKIKIQQITTKYKHTHTAFVEALNKVLAEQLFKVQDAQELNNPENVSDRLNVTKTQMIGISPKEAIKLKEILLVNQENYPPEDILPKDGLYCYLLQPGEQHDDQHRRAMDRILSKTYTG